MNSWEVPIAIFGFDGSNVMDCSVADETLRVVLPLTPPNVAATFVEPDATGVAMPLKPASLLITATDPLDELQVTCAVRSCCELSE